MTIADLRQILTPNNRYQENESLTRLAAALRGKQFFCGNLEGKGLCCFNHIMGLPEKQRIPKPIFDYEEKMFNE